MLTRCVAIAALAAPFLLLAEPTTPWEIIATVDDFTGSESYLIAPIVTDALSLDEAAIAVAQEDASRFLRPFVAFDNGVLLVGATTIGEIRMGANVIRSKYGPRDIQLKIGGNLPVDLPSANTPAHQLPGGRAEVTADNSSESAYTAVTGEIANELLAQMLGGGPIRIRRSPSGPNAALGQSALKTRTFETGSAFAAAIDRIGLTKDSGTGRWQLSPSRAAERARLLALDFRQTPQEAGLYALAQGKWVRLPSNNANFVLLHPAAIANVGALVGVVDTQGPRPPVVDNPLVLRFRGAVALPKNSPTGYPVLEAAPSTGSGRSRQCPLFTIRRGVFAFGDKRVPGTPRFLLDGTVELVPPSRLPAGAYTAVGGNDMAEFSIE